MSADTTSPPGKKVPKLARAHIFHFIIYLTSTLSFALLYAYVHVAFWYTKNTIVGFSSDLFPR